MDSVLTNTINALKEQIKLNLDEVRRNETRLREALFPSGDGNDRKLASAILDNNQTLLMQNFDILNLQLSLLKIVNTQQGNKRNEILKAKEESKVQYIDFFKETIEGRMTFDKTHPLFNDEVFFEKLFNYFMQIENYEMCEQIKNKKSINLQ